MKREDRIARISEVLDRVAVAVTTLDQDRHTLIDRIKLGLGRAARISDAADTDPVPDDLRGSIGHSDPTGNAAQLHRRDPRDVLREWDRAEQAAWAAVCALEAIASAHVPRPATDRERRDAERDNTMSDGCVSCARVDGYYEPTIRRAGLCNWCHDHRESGQDVPPIDLTRLAVAAKQQGKQPRTRVDPRK